jgi:large subunit ribosomal protein L18
MKIKTKQDRRERIHLRLRKRVTGTAERPRLSVFRSEAHIYAQVIDDLAGRTIVSASSVEPAVKAKFDGTARGSNKAGAVVVGKEVAERLREKGITRVVFDRGGFLYHGRVRAVAEAAREAGLEF